MWHHADSSKKGIWLLGHNGGDDGVSTDAFFNLKTGVGFMVFTNGDDSLKGYTKAMMAIETRIMATFDTGGGWPPPEEVVASDDDGRDGASAYYDEGARRAAARRRGRGGGGGRAGPPCGLPP